MDVEVKPKKIRLRRVGPRIVPPAAPFVSDDIIQKNLEPLRENVQKKKRAQDAYYENHLGTFGMSPLTRSQRRPVKQRLGRVNMPYVGTNSSLLLPKHRLRKTNSILNKRVNFKTNRNIPAQQRVYKVRTDKQKVTNVRPRRPFISSMEPSNLQIQVVNSSAQVQGKYNNNLNYLCPKRFKQILNTEIQMHIKKIQLQFTGSAIQPSKITPESTQVTINDRFARLK